MPANEEFDFAEQLALRNGSTQEKFRHFEYGHLPAGGMRKASALCTSLAMQMIEEIKDCPQLTLGLQKLIEAKDCFVRAARDTEEGHGSLR